MEGSNTPKPLGGGYESADESLRDIQERFDAWTLALSDRSVELSYAIVGANWAVFGSSLMQERWAKLSIALVIVFLTTNLVLTRIVAELLKGRYDYAESDPARWEREFQETKGKAVPWPSTPTLDSFARFVRELRTWLPLLAGGMFLVAVLFGKDG